MHACINLSQSVCFWFWRWHIIWIVSFARVSTGCLNDCAVVHTYSELLAFLLSMVCVRSVGSDIHVFVPPTQHWLRELSSDSDGFLCWVFLHVECTSCMAVYLIRQRLGKVSFHTRSCVWQSHTRAISWGFNAQSLHCEMWNIKGIKSPWHVFLKSGHIECCPSRSTVVLLVKDRAGLKWPPVNKV